MYNILEIELGIGYGLVFILNCIAVLDKLHLYLPTCKLPKQLVKIACSRDLVVPWCLAENDAVSP